MGGKTTAVVVLVGLASLLLLGCPLSEASSPPSQSPPPSDSPPSDSPSPAALAPLAPTGLRAIVVSATEIDLSWTDNSSNETKFVLERKALASAEFASIADITADTTVYNDSLLTHVRGIGRQPR